MSKIIVLGSLNIDLVVPVARLPRAGETLIGGDLAFFPGGKGANQACAAGKLGGDVAMVGQVGVDPFGATVVASLERAGVDTSGVGRSERATGSACISVLPNGENSIVVSPGANDALEQASAVERLQQLSPAKFLLCQLETPPDTVAAALRWARVNAVTTILDPAPVQILSSELLSDVDFLTPNQIEAATLIGEEQTEIYTFDHAAAVARKLLRFGPAGVILKLGRLGCFVKTEQIEVAVPGFEVDALDTTAAGDAFNGAFAVGLAEGCTIIEAARFANAAGALSVTRRGAQESMPFRAELERFLQEREKAACSL